MISTGPDLSVSALICESPIFLELTGYPENLLFMIVAENKRVSPATQAPSKPWASQVRDIPLSKASPIAKPMVKMCS